VTIQKLPVIACDPVTVVKICCDCVTFFVEHRAIWWCGHNPRCSSKNSAYWSDWWY